MTPHNLPAHIRCTLYGYHYQTNHTLSVMLSLMFALKAACGGTIEKAPVVTNTMRVATLLTLALHLSALCSDAACLITAPDTLQRTVSFRVCTFCNMTALGNCKEALVCDSKLCRIL